MKEINSITINPCKHLWLRQPTSIFHFPFYCYYFLKYETMTTMKKLRGLITKISFCLCFHFSTISCYEKWKKNTWQSRQKARCKSDGLIKNVLHDVILFSRYNYKNKRRKKMWKSKVCWMLIKTKEFFSLFHTGLYNLWDILWKHHN